VAGASFGGGRVREVARFQVRHVSGEVVDLGEQYEYYDENCDAATLLVRVENTKRARDVHASNAASCRASAERFANLSARREQELRTLRRIARQRGVLLKAAADKLAS
jgi:hypothetical protein